MAAVFVLILMKSTRVLEKGTIQVTNAILIHVLFQGTAEREIVILSLTPPQEHENIHALVSQLRGDLATIKVLFSKYSHGQI